MQSRKIRLRRLALIASILIFAFVWIIAHQLANNVTEAQKEACVNSVLNSGKPKNVLDDFIPSDQNNIVLPTPRRAPGIYLVTNDQAIICHVADEGQSPALSPDEQSIAFTGQFDGTYDTNRGDMYFPRPTDIYIMRLDGSNRHRITSLSNELRDGFFYSEPAWSPDGKQIAFVGQWQNSEDETIYVVNSDGSAPRCLCPARLRATHPKWTEYGDRIVFESLYYHEPYAVWFIMNVDGTDPHPLQEF